MADISHQDPEMNPWENNENVEKAAEQNTCLQNHS